VKRLVWITLALAAAGLAHETLRMTVLFDREIVRILDKHCIMCHTENGPSFPLMTYEQTWLQKRPIRADVIARHMPPRAAVSGYGQFANENIRCVRRSSSSPGWKVSGLAMPERFSQTRRPWCGTAQGCAGTHRFRRVAPRRAGTEASARRKYN